MPFARHDVQIANEKSPQDRSRVHHSCARCPREDGKAAISSTASPAISRTLGVLVPALQLSIDQLLADSLNPRFASADSQRETFQRVLDDQGDKLYALAASIVAEGMSPIDRLLVLKEKPGSDRYIALEGNRRVTALKILAEPSILTTLNLPASLRKRFEAEAKRFDRTKVEPLDAFEVEDRDEAKTWLHLRHTGENGGRGVVGWSGLASARFRGRDPALQALEFVKLHGGLTPEEEGALDDGFPITTLDRLLNALVVRKRIGIDVKDGKLISALDADELMKPLKKIVLDLATKRKNVSDLKNKKQQEEYVDAFEPKDRPDLTKVDVARTVETIGASDFKSKSKGKRGKKAKKKASHKTAKDETQRKTVVPSKYRPAIEDVKTAYLFKELRDLKLEDFPNAIAVLMRVFLEHSVDHYMAKHKMPTSFVPNPKNPGHKVEKSLHKKTVEVVDHLRAKSGADPDDFTAITRALSNKNSPFNVDLLNSYVHNRFTIPKENDLRSSWDEAQRLFLMVWS